MTHAPGPPAERTVISLVPIAGRTDGDQLGAGGDCTVAGTGVEPVGDDDLIPVDGRVDTGLNGRLVPRDMDDLRVEAA